MSRKPQCRVTCQGAVIRPPRPGAPFLRNQAFGIGTIGLGKARRLSDKLLAGSRELSGASPRCGFRCGLIEPSLTSHRLRPYRSSNRTAWRDPRSGCMPGPRPPTTPGRSVRAVGLDAETSLKIAVLKFSFQEFQHSPDARYLTLVMHCGGGSVWRNKEPSPAETRSIGMHLFELALSVRRADQSDAGAFALRTSSHGL